MRTIISKVMIKINGQATELTIYISKVGELFVEIEILNKYRTVIQQLEDKKWIIKNICRYEKNRCIDMMDDDLVTYSSFKTVLYDLGISDRDSENIINILYKNYNNYNKSKESPSKKTVERIGKAFEEKLGIIERKGKKIGKRIEKNIEKNIRKRRELYKKRSKEKMWKKFEQKQKDKGPPVFSDEIIENALEFFQDNQDKLSPKFKDVIYGRKYGRKFSKRRRRKKSNRVNKKKRKHKKSRKK